MTPLLVILSSPSGGGKTTIARTLIASRDDIGYSVSATTRAPRPRERDGVDYYFLSDDEFSRRLDAGEFLEWAEYSSHRYGTLRAEVERLHGEGRHVILDIEVRGAAQVRQRGADVVSIFVLPPSAAALVERLERRGADAPRDLARRLERADRELDEALAYDYVVINDELDEAVREVAAIIDGTARQVNRQQDLAERIARLRDGLRQERDRLNSEQ